MQLGTEIGKMTRKLFTGFSKSRPWMLNTGDQMAAHRRSDRRRVYLCAGGLRNRQSDGSGTDALAGETGMMRVVDIYWTFGTRPWVNYGKSNVSQ